MVAQSRMRQFETVADIVTAIREDLRTQPSSHTGGVRTVRRRHSKALIEASPQTVLAVADAFLIGSSAAERLLGAELLVARLDAVRRLSGARVERWAEGLASWGSIDMYGVTVAGVAWREGRVSDSQVMRWARSSDRWRRRLALVATVPLNSRARGGSGDAVRTLRVCADLVADRDDMVVKALSWALRELSKTDPESVARFVRKEGSRLASRVLREVTSKLETGRKVRLPTRER
jgi:3-methyladenine DNA glycosylase AlkD